MKTLEQKAADHKILKRAWKRAGMPALKEAVNRRLAREAAEARRQDEPEMVDPEALRQVADDMDAGRATAELLAEPTDFTEQLEELHEASFADNAWGGNEDAA